MWAGVFPGQGSQEIGMGQVFYNEFKIVRDTFEEASDVLKMNMKNLCFEGPLSELTLTENTQPAILLVSTALYRLLKQEIHVPFSYYAGHSVGEYAALVAAGCLQFEEALRSVKIRGQAMQNAVPVGEGGMLAAIGFNKEQINILCSWVQETSGLKPIEAANYNSFDQIVLSGSKKAIEWLQTHYRADILTPAPSKTRFIPLQVSAPFHSSLMKPAEEKMKIVLESISFQVPTKPIIQNRIAQEVSDPQTLRKNLIEQVSAPVLWVQSMMRLKELNISHLIEIGNGKVISGLVRKIDGNYFKCFNLNSIEDLKMIEKVIKE